jgi:branched-subunit amino acid aminotransferase/4-amino-4-deoxychorismate lyase
VKFFGLRSHIERLRASVAGFGRALSFDEEEFVAALSAAAADATAVFDSETRIRIDVAAEPAAHFGTKSNVLLAVTPYRGLPEDVRANGAFLRTAPGLARPDPAVKTSNFIPLREAWIAAHGDGKAYEYVMLNGDRMILEGTQSNLGFVKAGAVYFTPRDILPGVTQRAVIDLAREAGIEVRMEFVPLAELGGFDEAFMTTSVRSVVPVGRIDDIEFARNGQVTRELSALYDALTARDAVAARDRASARY